MFALYFTTVVIYIYTYWTQVINILKFALKIVLAWKKLFNAVRDRIQKRKQAKSD